MAVTTQESETSLPPEQPKAYQGDPRSQLAHLQAHIRFQRQEQQETIQFDRITTMTRAQSYRYITGQLHRKLNAKAEPKSRPEGKLATEEGHQFLKALALRIKRRERLSAGDVYRLPFALRRKVLAADRSPTQHEAHLLPAKNATFPETIRQAHEERTLLKRMLREQGISPKRHRDYIALQAHYCNQCKNINTVSEVERDKKCPHCGNPEAR